MQGRRLVAGCVVLVAGSISVMMAAGGCSSFASDDASDPDGTSGDGAAEREDGPSLDAPPPGRDAGPSLHAVFVRSFGSADDAGDAGATMRPPAMVVDPSGAVALLGSYSGGAVALGAGALLPAPVAEDVYLAKLDGAGVPGAVRAFGGNNDPKDQFASSLAGSSAMLYASVIVDGTLELSPGVYVASEGVAGKLNGAVARLDGNLVADSIVTLRGSQNVLAKHVASGISGSVVAFGDWENGISINGGSQAQRDPGSTGLFVGRFFGVSGQVVAHTGYCGSDSSCIAGALGTNPATGDSLLGGRFRGTLEDGSGGSVSATIEDEDAFLLKLDAQLNRSWVLALGGSGTQEVHAIAAVPQTTDFVAAGTFDGTFTAAGSPPVTTKGFSDIFVVRVTAAGKVVWGKTFGGAGIDRVRGVVADAAGHVFLTGHFAGPTLDIDGLVLANADVGGSATSDAFVAWLDTMGTRVHAARFGDPGNDVASAIGLAGNGDVVVAGTFDGALVFGTGAPVKARGRTDTFVIKLAR